MFIPALDPELSKRDLHYVDPKFLELQIDYGLGMLQASLLLGAAPILAEYQIVDSTAVLREAARSSDFRALVSNGDIHLSWFKKEGYAAALRDKLARPGWISSGWPAEIRGELGRRLSDRTLTAAGDWPESARELLDGLQFFESFDRRKPSVKESQSDTKSFHQRLHWLAQNLEQLVLPEDSEKAKHARRLLDDAENLIERQQRNNRSPWLTLLRSEDFKDGHHENWEGHALAVHLIYFASQLSYCQTTSNGSWLYSVAYASYDDGSGLLKAGQVLPIAEALSGNDASGSFVFDEKEAIDLKAINWADVARVRSDLPLLRLKIDQAKKGAEGKAALSVWLQKELATGAAAPGVISRFVIGATKALLPSTISIDHATLTLPKTALAAVVEFLLRKDAAITRWDAAGHAANAVLQIGERGGLL